MASKLLKAKKNEYSALQTTDIEEYPGGAVTFYKTKNLLESSRGAYLCRFACAFDELSDEQLKANLKARKQLWTASIFCFVFMCAEFTGGYLAHSLALMSDASHLLSDLGSLMVSIFALWLTSKRSSDRLSFGYHRAEILGALLSAFIIWGLTVFLVYKAVMRIIYPEHVHGEIMFIVACAGILVNVIMGFILHQSGHSHSHGGIGSSADKHGHGDAHSHERKGGHSHSHEHKSGHSHSHKHDKKTPHVHKKSPHSHSGHDDDEKSPENKVNPNSIKNINVRSAFIHVIGDLIQSLGVLTASALIWYDHDRFRVADPICTLAFSVLVVFTTIYMVRDAFDVLMESVPRHIDVNKIRKRLLALPDVAEVHDLHVWMLSLGKPALSVHLIVKQEETVSLTLSSTPEDTRKLVCLDGILRKAQHVCLQEFGIDHCTIQIEWPREEHKSAQKCPEYCVSPTKEEQPNLKQSRSKHNGNSKAKKQDNADTDVANAHVVDMTEKTSTEVHASPHSSKHITHKESEHENASEE